MQVSDAGGLSEQSVVIGPRPERPICWPVLLVCISFPALCECRGDLSPPPALIPIFTAATLTTHSKEQRL
jgi:hypothetical protein